MFKNAFVQIVIHTKTPHFRESFGSKSPGDMAQIAVWTYKNRTYAFASGKQVPVLNNR